MHFSNGAKSIFLLVLIFDTEIAMTNTSFLIIYQNIYLDNGTYFYNKNI